MEKSTLDSAKEFFNNSEYKDELTIGRSGVVHLLAKFATEMSNTNQLTTEQVDALILELDQYATDYDHYEYGLPVHEPEITDLRCIINDVVNNPQ